VTTDPLHQAVDTLSALLKRLWELRQKGDFTTLQTKAIDRLVDETLVSILSLIRKIRETSSSQNRISMCSSQTVRKAFH
jgi:hypothetical protein